MRINTKNYLLSLILPFTNLVFVSCNPHKYENKCNCYTVKELLSKSNSLHVVAKKGKSILELRDKGRDSLRDGEYYFNESGCLVGFKFFANNEAYTYGEDYDSAGNITRTDESPLAYQSIKEISGIDSIFCRFYYFSLFKSFGQFEIESSDRKKVFVELVDDTNYVNMKVAKFGYNYQNLDSIELFLKFTYVDLCNQKKYFIIDTVSLGVQR